MARLTCTACDQPIPNGEAVITSRLFEQRAWHRDCAPGRVPEQRRPTHDMVQTQESPAHPKASGAIPEGRTGV